MLILLDMIWHDHISCWVSILSESALWVRGSWFLLRPFFLGVQFSNFKTHGIHRLHPMHSQLVELSLAPRTEQTTWLVSLSGHGSWRALNSLKKTRVCAYHPVIKHDLLENPPCIDKFRSWKAPVFFQLLITGGTKCRRFHPAPKPSRNSPSTKPPRSVDSCWTADHWLGKVRCPRHRRLFLGKKMPRKGDLYSEEIDGNPMPLLVRFTKYQ